MTLNVTKNTDIFKIERSQRYFNQLSLSFYDLLLYGLVSKYAWGCPVERLDAHYRKYMGANHLEVGVGTGYLLSRALSKRQSRLALMDLNAACLRRTKLKVASHRPEIYVQNLLEPVRNNIQKFDSIAINYVMHCVPGSFREKGIAFDHLKLLMNPGGVLFGTTVLSEAVDKNLFAKSFMWLLNALGVFNNSRDNARDLRNCLENNFEVLDFEVVGVTAFFSVRR